MFVVEPGQSRAAGGGGVGRRQGRKGRALPAREKRTSAACQASIGFQFPERLRALLQAGWLTEAGAKALAAHAGSTESVADAMSENVIGVHGLPLALGLNFKINGEDFIAPMCVEEPSVVAAASNAARLARESGGFFAETDEPLMVAQVQLLNVPDPLAATRALLDAKPALLAPRNQPFRRWSAAAVARAISKCEFSRRRLPAGAMLVVHLIVDTRDAMGANALNTLAEAMAAPLQGTAGGKIGLRILSNLSDRPLRARQGSSIPCASLA